MAENLPASHHSPLLRATTDAGRRLRIFTLLAAGSGPETERLCHVGAEIIGVTGAGLILMSGGSARGSLCASDEMSALVERLQYDLGEGPCVDACRSGRPVQEPDLAQPAAVRWPAFAEPAVTAGVRAVFGFPLVVGAARFGALSLCRDRPGPLTDDQHADALVLASVAAQAILALQAGAPAEELAIELEAGADFHLVTHQAAGMVSAQLEVDIGQALVRLRAHAFGASRPVVEVAASVVSKELRFNDHSDGKDHPL